MGAGQGPALRIFLYNPCSLIVTGRLVDVATTPRADTILCPGSRIRATIGEPCRVQSMGSLGLAIHYQSKCWLLDYPGSTTGKKGAGERDSGCTTPNRGQRCSQNTHGRDGTRSSMLLLAPTSGNREKMKTQKAASV